MESNESPILRGLNPAQYDAVVNYDVPSLIIAGAGSGKTRVLTSRIAYMIEQGVAPFNILALTFTNKAAESMRERIAQMLPDNRSRYIRMGTFHSVFSRILRENAERIGFTNSFTIYEPSDCKNLLKTIVRELNLPDEKYKPNLLASRISYAKNCLVTPGAYQANTVCATEDRQAQIPEFGNIYNIYCQRCKRNGAMDFDDLLLQTNILLRDCPDVLARYQEQFRYILVDEYQDTNYAQYTIIRRLSQTHSKVCVVGDDAQSIYSFRGAKIENILSFKKDYPSAMVFKLEQNYRSTRTIVDAANSVIARNSKRMEKHCFSDGDVGEKIRILKAYTDREEAEMVVTDLRDKVRAADDDWSEAVILYRTNNQSAVLEDNLRRRGIPYCIYKGSSFYDHKEIKDMMAYIRLVINPRDDEAFKRIVNYPARGIGDTTVQRIAQLAAERGQSMWEAVDALVAEPVTDPVQKTIARKVTDFVAMIRSLSLSRNDKGLYDFGLEIASRSGIIAAYRAENTPEATSALDNIEELLNSMQEFKERCDAEIRNGERPEEEVATIEEWLQNVMLMTDMDKDNPDDNNKVTLMTVHSAKGLEYKYVYIVGLEENLFPSQRAAESPDGIEEERRLFYVALTRAKVSATISYAEMRFKWGNMEFSRPSCFLREIDPRYVESDADFAEVRPRRRDDDGEVPSAIDELRRRFDYRFQQKQQGGSRFGGSGGNGGGRSGSYSGGSGGRSGGFGRPADGESGPARRFARAAQPQRSGTPDPALVQTPRPSTDGMRRVGVRQAMDGGLSAGSAAPVSGEYAVGQRVEHPKFGVGIVQRIETLATDHKLVVAFDNAGEKTLLAKFAKLTKL
ncbi:UvrD-helicase domain-containing protein [Alistipes senegalensis]|uniref:ATP-dependent helicase n=1 Tax=Alistipes senegalensis TaxID=1288121 RepID=UPI002430D5BB|nr:UvrD-helicase domain-containing protein [Alistipes senegalensis]MCI7308912.1 UvrD-helicase domain-containing protein [Alistipes senegalensis]MDD7039949.1 UvrD-helicase domain-containing protein [Alistipes senegalensis]